MAKTKFYVVWKGYKPGIYETWSECEAQVKGFTGAKYKSFVSMAAAEAAFAENYADHLGKAAASGQWLFASNPPVIPSICVDAACSGSPGPLEYRGVMTETNEQIFQAGPFADGTNNVGEFLAIVHALEWLKKKGTFYPIYTDSEVAITWIKLGKCRTKMTQTRANTALFYLIARAEKWLAENNIMVGILKWDTEAWGEIPADFGRK